jgi:hypothetical protein
MLMAVDPVPLHPRTPTLPHCAHGFPWEVGKLGRVPVSFPAAPRDAKATIYRVV